MRTTDRIGFKLIIKEPDTAERTIVVCPRYEGLKMKWQRESGKVYHTLDFDGNLEFWGVDFVTLLNCPLRTVFELVVFLKGRGEVGRSEFRKTDCEWNLNDGWCKVDISTYDKYSKINDHKDDEYNLIKMGLEKKQLSLNVYPSRQLYVEGDTKAVLFSATDRNEVTTEERRLALSWNEPSSSNTDTMENDIAHGWRFGYCARIFIVIDVKEEESAAFADRYVVSGYTYVSSVGGSLKMDEVTGTGLINGKTIKAQLNETQLSGWLLNGTNGVMFAVNGTFDNIFLGTTQLFFHAPGQSSGGFNSSCRMWVTWSRLVCYSSPLTNIRLLSNDLVEKSNMKYALWPERHDATTNPINVAVSNRVSDTPTEYGIVEGTSTYYLPPDDTHKWTALRQDSWMRGISFWAGENYTTQYERQWYTGNENVKDFYLFTDAVRAVIKKIDPNIEFEDSDSHFLTDTNNPVSGNPQDSLYISQKSNVLNLGYDYPAWQAPVKWSQIETFLRNALGCYWDLYEDANGVTHLRIEHQSFYDNGGTYNPQGNPSATIDLLHDRFDVATRQPQAFHTNRWTWDVDGNGLYSSACRYEYGWMDTQSAIFDGETIEVPEEYRLFTDDKTEERKVDWFSSDIDFLTAVQAECSSDGFVVVMESYMNPGWIVSGHENYSGQNYQMSFEYLQPLYLVYGIYAEKVQIGDNGTAYDTGSHARMRTSEVSFNLLEGEWVEPSDVLITEVGGGVIDTLTYDMSSEKWTATVRYNNE